MNTTSGLPPHRWVFITFCGVVALAVFLALIALVIRRFLPPPRSKGKKTPDSTVNASFFRNQLRYATQGPVAEFVILLGTLLFVATVLWALLTWNGGH